MLERIAGLADELRAVEARLGDPAVRSDPSRLAELGRRFKRLDEIVAVGRSLESASDDLDEARRMLSDTSDSDDRAELRALIEELDRDISSLEDRLRALLLPKDPNAGRSVIVEIRGTDRKSVV